MTDMKNFLSKVSTALSPLGFRKSGNKTYRRLRDGVYHLVNIQPSAFGNYFYINIGVHAKGMPFSCSSKSNNPGIDDCEVQQRVSDIVGHERFEELVPYPVSPSEEEKVEILISMLMNEVQSWLERIGELRYLSEVSVDELRLMMPVVPISQPACAWLMKSYCAKMLEDSEAAKESYENFHATKLPKYDFTSEEQFFDELLAE